MKVKFKYDNLEFDFDVNSLEDLFDQSTLIRSTIFTMSDEEIKKTLEIYKNKAQNCATDNVSKSNNKNVSPKGKNTTEGQKQAKNEEPEVVIEMITPGQKNYMEKLGVPYDDTLTKEEAIIRINDFKRARGWKIEYDPTQKLEKD